MRVSNLIGILCVSRLFFTATAAELPPGVPSPLAPDGTYTDAIRFTTKAYQEEAFKLVLQEANLVAKELRLPEKLPINRSHVVRAFISPFGDAYANRRIGNITTENYVYGVAADNKFSVLHKTHLDE